MLYFILFYRILSYYFYVVLLLFLSIFFITGPALSQTLVKGTEKEKLEIIDMLKRFYSQHLEEVMDSIGTTFLKEMHTK